ncbi:hypothetical protein Droror1_Dr00000038 [Drosera rotundifolia]
MEKGDAQMESSGRGRNGERQRSMGDGEQRRLKRTGGLRRSIAYVISQEDPHEVQPSLAFDSAQNGIRAQLLESTSLAQRSTERTGSNVQVTAPL